MLMDVLEITERGLYCPAGDFYIDPWTDVERAVITHAHSDHARIGSRSYLAALPGERVLRARLGDEASIRFIPYGERITIGDAAISLHPAGHILGSAQIRIESRGEVWVVSGDYKTQSDPTCAPFEAIPCHGFVTEATFALPIYRWRSPGEVFGEINLWWKQNRDQGKASILYAYPLGKAQRILAGIDSTIGPILTHGSVERLTAEYRASGVALPPTQHAMSAPKKLFAEALILAPPMSNGNPWLRRFGDQSSAMASGWMRVRGARRRRSIDRGFVLSDHADWPALLATIAVTEAETIWATHGHTGPLVRWLQESGKNARGVVTHFEGETDENNVPENVADPEAGRK
jgi:putative mRNA 3-end processing factor